MKARMCFELYHGLADISILSRARSENGKVSHMNGRQENSWAPGQKETWPPSSNSPNNDTQTMSTTVYHKQGISTAKRN